MRFLLVSYNFAPEKTGIGKYNGEWAAWLAERGHLVDVITSNPYYPEWKVEEAYRDNQWRVERKGRLTIYRVPMYIPARVTGISRIISDISFVLTSLTAWARLIWQRQNYDVVIAVCPSMLNGIVPAIYSKLTGSFMLYHVQDLQLDAAVNLGFIRSRLLQRLLRWIEKVQLTSATVVSSISEGMRDKLLAKGVEAGRYLMIPNWVDTDFIRPEEAGAGGLRQAMGFMEEDKVILYSGNIGEKQGIEVIIEAAALLKDQADWKFLICGEGVIKNQLVTMTKEKGLANVFFRPLQSYELLPDLLNMADLHLVPQKRAAADLVLPSKLTGILAAGGVSIVACERGATLFELINQNRMGYTVEPENAQELAGVIRMALTGDHVSVRQAARRYAESHMGKAAILRQFEDFILTGKAGPG